MALAGLALGAASTFFAVREPPIEPSGEIVALAPALKRTDAGEPLRWAPRPIDVHLDPSLADFGRDGPDAVVRGFGAWIDAPVALPSVSFVHSRESARGARRDGKSTVSRARIELAGREHDLAITVTYSDSATGEIMEADIVLNAAHDLDLLDERDVAGVEIESSCNRGGVRGCSSGYDLESIVAHEVGHFFGLGEDRDDQRATMYLCTSRCELHKRTLKRSDYELLGELYAGGTLTRSEGGSCAKRGNSSTSWAE